MNYWFGQIPVGWRVMKLKHLCQIKTQKTNIKTNYVGLENIASGTSEFVFVETEPEGDNLIFNKNDVLFGKLRPYLAKVWLADKDGCCSSEFLVLHSDILIPEYLKYLLLSPKFIDRVNGSTFGSKMPRANWEFIGNQWMPVPSKEEQQEIVDELNGKISVVDKLTNDVNRKIKLLSEYRQALIDFKVSGGGDSKQSERSKRIALRRLVKIDPNTVLPKIGCVEYLPMEQIKRGIFIHRKAELSKLPLSLNAFAEGDILLAKVTPCFENGNLCRAENLCNGVGCCSTELFVIRCQSELIEPDFLLLLFQQEKFRQEAIKMMRGTGGLKRIPVDWLQNYKVEVPERKKQIEIVNFVREESRKINFCINKLRNEVIKLGEYRCSFISYKVLGE